MRLSKNLSNKCQLILIPGETRVVEVEAPGVQRLELFIAAAGEDGGYCLGQGAGRLEITVPDDLVSDKQWSGTVFADGEPLCCFDVKVLSRELAQMAGYYNGGAE